MATHVPGDLDTRNLALELVRVIEGAALASARFMGRDDKEAADLAAVDSMRRALSFVDMDGAVVIGEGEKDQAPMLYIGEHVGNGSPPQVDVAVNPIDATRLVADGAPRWHLDAIHRRSPRSAPAGRPKVHGKLKFVLPARSTSLSALLPARPAWTPVGGNGRWSI